MHTLSQHGISHEMHLNLSTASYDFFMYFVVFRILSKKQVLN